MQIEYYPPRSKAPVFKKVSAEDLAGYLGTEWIPGTPRSFIDSLTEIIGTILTRVKLNGSVDSWCVNADVADTDRQWRGVTSWIIGVAFARDVMESEGYSWWSPVSGFSGTVSTGKTKTGRWMPWIPRSLYSVEKLGTKSNLLPDYTACRLSGDGTFQYAFVESKGTKNNIQNKHLAPADWLNQVNNAKLLFRERIAPVAHRYVVATRINPDAKRANTRRIIVRAWDSQDDGLRDDFFELAHFLTVHYAGLLQRIGFHRAADLLTRRIRLITETDRSDFATNEWRDEFDDFANDLPLQTLDRQSPIEILTEPNSQSGLRFGDSLYYFGLSLPVIQLLRTLITGNVNGLQTTLDSFYTQTQELREDYSGNPEISTFLNGVVVYR